MLNTIQDHKRQAGLFTIIGIMCIIWLLSICTITTKSFPSDTANWNLWVFILISVSVLSLFWVVLFKKKYVLQIGKADMILLILISILLIHSILQKNNKPILIAIPILYGAVSGLFIRIFSFNGKIKIIILYSIILAASIQAIIGLLQYFNIIHPLYTYYKFTGTFLHPSILAGFLTMAFPLSVWFWLQKKRILFLVITILFLIALILSESRSAWISTFCSSIFLLRNTKTLPIANSLIFKRQWTYIPIALICIIPIGKLLYNYKQDSANGRLLIWKITTELIHQKPIVGWGLGNFEYQYGNAQEMYFRKNNINSQEALLADNNQYAFNEYLQIYTEWGLVGLCVIVTCSILCIKSFNRKHPLNIPIASSLISLACFSLFSYPLRHYATYSLFIILLALYRSTGTQVLYKHKIVARITILIILMITSIGVYQNYQIVQRWMQYKQYQKISSLHPLEEVCNFYYSNYYNDLSYRSDFLIDYIQKLIACNRLHEAHYELFHLSKRSGHSMIYHFIGETYWKIGDYENAEKYLWHAFYRVPNRYKPLYSLLLLYKEQCAFQKAKYVASIIINQPIKIYSPEINFIKREAEKTIYDKL